MPEILRGFALIGELLAVTVPVVYACMNERLVTDIILNPVFYVSLLLVALFFYEQLRPYLQCRHLRIDAVGIVMCFILTRWIESEEVSVNLLCIAFNLCAYFNEFFACLFLEEEY